MTKQIETTLQDAAERTKANGGCFSHRDITDPYKYKYDKHSTKFIDQHGKFFELEYHDFDRVWIYEPPNKSAFEEWDNSEPVNDDPVHNENWHRRRGRKEGWNAAIGAAIELTKIFNLNISKKVEELKEP